MSNYENNNNEEEQPDQEEGNEEGNDGNDEGEHPTSVNSQNVVSNYGSFNSIGGSGGGDGYYFNESIENANLFFYDEKSIKWFKAMIGHTDFEIKEAQIKDHERIFGGKDPKSQGAMVNIMPKADSNVYGYMIKLTGEESMKIEEYYKLNENKDWSFIEIFDLVGNKYKGITFVCENAEKMDWIDYPTQKVLKRIYALFSLSKNKNMSIYDNKFTVRGYYNGNRLQSVTSEENSMYDTVKKSDTNYPNPILFKKR